MAIGVNGLLSTGQNALLSSQVGINVTSNNVANVNTAGYVRQSVIFQDSLYVDSNPGQIGTGSYAQEIVRDFDRFLENSFLDQNSQANRWNEQAAVMASVENLFNEANTSGLHNQLSEFFNTWSTLSTTPNSDATREDLLAQTENLTTLIQHNMDYLNQTKAQMNDYIGSTVDAVNAIIEQIADLNVQIDIQHQPPYNNANGLLDERDRLVRELGTYVDVSVQEEDGKNFAVYLKEGMPLVEGQTAYSLSTNGPFVESNAKMFNETTGTYEEFTGELVVEGEDHREYLLEFVNGNEFRISYDNGKTWAIDSNGQSTFQIPPVGERLVVGDLKFSIQGEDFVEGQTPYFETGSQFYVVAKDNVQWHEPTRDPLDVSKTVNGQSIGGKLGAYIDVKDVAIGEYQDQLNALAEALIWEVNRLHSQGSGLEAHTQNIGNTIVEDTDLAFASPWQEMPFAERLTGGNMNVAFYDATTGEPLENLNLNFNPSGGPQENFDPEIHSLTDVVDAINRSFVDESGNQLMTATIVSGQLQLTAADNVNYHFGSDTTGLMAALGVNTFFAGSNAHNITVNPHLVNNVEKIAAQGVDGQDQANVGDGSIASMIASLATKNIDIKTPWASTHTDIVSYYAGTVGLVGADTRNANFNSDYYSTLAEELDMQVQSKSAVNLDEEMVLLIKFQHSYTAAAKLITTADEMFQTILGLKV